MIKSWTIQRRQLTDEVIAAELQALEHAHGMTSDQFLPRFNRGELGDDEWCMYWAALLGIASKRDFAWSHQA